MKRTTASPLPKLCNLLMLLFALFLPSIAAAGQASSANPCAAYPGVCRYTWDPVERCCISDPRFDCFDICFASATAPAGSWLAELAPPLRPVAASPAGAAPGAPADGAAPSSPGSGQR